MLCIFFNAMCWRLCKGLSRVPCRSGQVKGARMRRACAVGTLDFPSTPWLEGHIRPKPHSAFGLQKSMGIRQ